MRVSTATGHAHRLRPRTPRYLLWILLLVAGLGDNAAAQAIRFGLEETAPAELTPPRVESISGPTAARLQQAQALVAERHWAEAIEIYRQLVAAESDRVVALDERRYAPLRTYCHWQIARLPAEALAIYRRLVDPLAEQWLRDGTARRDESLLRRVVDELYCSSWGDDALLVLGEIALEQADYGAARGWWLQISPLLRGPDGRPSWIALHDLDLEAHWPEVKRRWFDRSDAPDWLAYPDTSLDLADVRARLVLVSIRADQAERAALELDLLRRLHPDAAGRLGGQQGPYAAALERLLTSASEWPAAPGEAGWSTFAGSPARGGRAALLGPLLMPAWPTAVELVQPAETATSDAPDWTSPSWIRDAPVAAREPQRPLSCFPILIGDLLLYGDAAGVHAVSLASGEPAVTAGGLLHESDWSDEPRESQSRLLAGKASEGTPRCTLTAAGKIVYFRTGRPATTLLEPGTAAHDRIVGLDLARDGLLTYSRRPPGAAWSFDGAPISDGRRVFVALRQSDVTAHAYVACFDASTGAEIWRTPIGAADTRASGRADEVTHNLLTLVGKRIYFNTNLGLVAALDATDGHVDWLFRYDRAREIPVPPSPSAQHFDRDPSPCLYHAGLVVVAPTDAPTVFALDAHTGQIVWASDRMPDALHLLGVVEENLVLGGHRLRVVDVRSGEPRFIWPESEHAGIRGKGRGLVAGEEIFWPTRDTIYVIHALTGQRTRSPIDLRALGEGGANLAAAHGHLVIAGYNKVMALRAAPVGEQLSTLQP